MALPASKLKDDTYRILDSVLETGVAVEVERRGKTLKISLEKAPESRSRRKLDDLRSHPEYLQGDPQEVVHLDWSGDWRP